MNGIEALRSGEVILLNKMKEKLLVSFSGGRTSAYMTWWLHENCRDRYEMKVVFANTGKEREETLRFVEQCDKHFGWSVIWVECMPIPAMGDGVAAREVTFETASRNGEPFEAMIKKYGIPNVEFKHCSRVLKSQTIQAYMRCIGWQKYKTAIGIRKDEQEERINWETAKKSRLLYPLVSMTKTYVSDINFFWSKMPFDLELKSYEGNCDMCFKKSLRKLITIANEAPERLEWWREMERKYGHFVPASRQHNQNGKLPTRFYRGNMSVEDLKERASQPFQPAIDTSKGFDLFKQMEMFDMDMDTTGGCEESCEAF